MKIEKYFDKQLKLFRWRVDVTISGQRVRKGKFATRDAATKFVVGLQAISRFEQWGLPLPQSATSVFEFVEMARLKSSQQMQRLALDELSALVKTDKPLRQLKRVDLAAYYEQLQQRQLKPGTVIHYKNALMALLRRAGEWFADLEDWQPPKFPRLPRPTLIFFLFDHSHPCLLHFDCVGDLGASAAKLHGLGSVQFN